MALSGGARFRPSRNFERTVRNAAPVKRQVRQVTKEIADRYRAGVGVDEGDLRDSISGELVDTDAGAEGLVLADDWKARLHEFGTADTKPNGALRKAIDSLGLKINVEARGNRVVGK